MATKKYKPEDRIWHRGKYKGWKIKDLPDDFLLTQLWLAQNNKRKQEEDPYVHIIIKEAHRRQTEHKVGTPDI